MYNRDWQDISCAGTGQIETSVITMGMVDLIQFLWMYNAIGPYTSDNEKHYM